MTIEEVADRHWRIGIRAYHFSTPKQEHTKLSIEFAISILKEINNCKTTELTLIKLSDKIQELKTYLDEKS